MVSSPNPGAGKFYVDEVIACAKLVRAVVRRGLDNGGFGRSIRSRGPARYSRRGVDGDLRHSFDCCSVQSLDADVYVEQHLDLLLLGLLATSRGGLRASRSTARA